MNKNNAKNFAAYSLVEVQSEVNKFISEDRTHPAVESIYDELNRLISILQRIGYNPHTNIVLHNVGQEKNLNPSHTIVRNLLLFLLYSESPMVLAIEGKIKYLSIDFLYSRGLATSDSYTRHVLHCVQENDFVEAKRL
ncbi:hypothetical protein Ahy_B08g092949 isoform A [Arachis hypogaea]|uniref:Uncharacterized protein n=1 Tax=Arachis hypogaea TaxID=3818 RepID=A0A444Y4Z5_ARAHY|nr:hypothetical protein Ahy_B08g092949 isoform A [Arachis hypogaea]